MKTLLFCTSYVYDETAWQQRYQRWLTHHRLSRLAPDAIVMIDDHSPFLPEHLEVLHACDIGVAALPGEAIVRFGDRVGRAASTDFPGWWRGMFASVCLAHHYGFDRIIHIESDSFVLSERLIDYLASRTTGWTALWNPYHKWPESAAQVLCRDAFHLLHQFVQDGPFGFRKLAAELVLPFTHVEKGFIGDRYHEYGEVASDADYSVQNRPTADAPKSLVQLEGFVLKPIAAVKLPVAHADRLLVKDVRLHAAGSLAEQQLGALAAAFPLDADIACQYGVLAYENDHIDAARSALERADWIRPEHGLTCKFLAATRMRQGELAGAVSAASQSARLNSQDAEALNMAGAFHLQAHLGDAVDYFRASLALNPEGSAALSNLARIDWTAPDMVEQFPGGFRAIQLEVRAALMRRLQNNTLTSSGAAALLAFGVHFQKDFELLQQLAGVLIGQAETDAQTLFVCGNVLIVAGDFQSALTAYRKAAALAPQSERIRNAIGYALIRSGGEGLSEGFRIANNSWPHINPAAYAAHPAGWDGDGPAPAKLLVYQEQGIGDALICLRFLPLLAARAPGAMLWLKPELAVLVADQTGLPLWASHDRPDATLSGFSSVSSLFGLIDALRISSPQSTPQLTIRAPALAVEQFARRLSKLTQLRVGLCLFGNPDRSDDWVRSVPQQQILPFADQPGIDWVNLAVDMRSERLALQHLLPEMVDLADKMTDFSLSAALITNLDVVVTIDCVIAHLAAALGKPVLLLNSTVADWRWKIGTSPSPWWPSVEVFDANKPGDFELAIKAALSRLATMVEDRLPVQDRFQKDSGATPI